MGYRHGMHWNDTFLALFDRCVAAYRAGNRDFESYYSPPDLVSIRNRLSHARVLRLRGGFL
jgi:hypothetical protein